MLKKYIIMLLIINSLNGQTNKQFTVSYDPDYAPFSYNLEGKPYGLFIDIWKKWGEKNNYNIKFKAGESWDDAIELAKNGDADFFIGTKPYEKWMKSSLTYYKTKTSLFKLKSNQTIIKKIGIIGSDYEKELKEELKDITISSYETYKELTNALISKDIDAIYDDSIAITDFIYKNSQNHKIIKIDKLSTISDINTISNNSRNIDIFNKGFHNINQETLELIESNWIANESERYYINSTDNSLTKKENQWLEKNPISRVAIMNYWPKDANNNSLHTEILKLINKYAGTNIVPVRFDTWEKAYSQATKGKELHGIMGLSYSIDREKEHFNYTSAYNFTPSYLITKRDNNNIKLIEDIKNKTIYVKNKSIINKMLSQKYPTTKVINLNSLEDIYTQFSTTNDADAFITYFLDKEKIKKYNLKIVKTLYDRYGEVGMGINNKYTELHSIINKAFKLIPKTEIAKVRNKKWGQQDKYKLNEDDEAYLKNKKIIKVCINPNWEPIEFKEDKNPNGISIDILKILKEKLNVNYQFIKTDSWKQSQDFLKEKKCDILPSAVKTKEREQYANFTKAYLNYDLAIVTTADKPLVTKFESITGQSMSRKKGSGLISNLKNKYPYIKIFETSGSKESLEAVIDESVYFTIVTVPVFSYYKSKYGLNNLQVAGYTDMKYNLSMAVVKDDEILLNILNKTLATISKSTFDIIHDKWATTKVVKHTNWTLIFQLSGLVLLIIMFILFNNRKLQQMVDQKTADIEIKKRELEHLVSSFDKNVIASRTDNNGIITYVSEAFCTISGYTQNELLGKSHSVVKHSDTSYETFKELWKTIKDSKIWKGEIKNRKKDGSFYWVSLIVTPEYDSNGSLHGYSAIREDITSKKEVEELTANLEIRIEERTAELAQQKENVEQILANILLPVFITSKEKRTVVYANKFAQNLYDMDEKDIIGTELDSIYKLTNGPQEIIKQIKETGRVIALEEEITTHSGKEFVGLLSVTPISYNNEDCYIGMTVDITKQKDMENEIRAVHKHTRESIEYAALIQGALIPDNNLFGHYFKDSFVTWHPKDTVGGDIYQFAHLRDENECLLMFIDCTGHGVPGAFVTMIVKAIEREIVAIIKEDNEMEVSPAWIMSYFNKTMKMLLKQDTKDSISNAGWDGGIIYYNKKDKILKFAGAETPLFYVDTSGEFNTIKGNRYSVGYKKCEMDYKYKETILEVEDGMKFYCTTDGYLDQNGGEKDFPFGKKRFSNIIKDNHYESMEKQQTIFLHEMNKYESVIPNNDRNDDMTLIGFKI